MPLRKFEKNRMARFRELDHILDFGHEVSRPGKGDGAGPSPLLKSPKFPKKRRPPRRARLNRWLGARRWERLVKVFVVSRPVVLWVHVAKKRLLIFFFYQTSLKQNTTVEQHWHSKTLSASTVASLRAVGAETIFRSMCFSQVHSHLPDREDVNVLDCITFCDPFSHQNQFNCQTYAPIRKTHVTLHVSLPFTSDSEQWNKKKRSKISLRNFWYSVGNY